MQLDAKVEGVQFHPVMDNMFVSADSRGNVRVPVVESFLRMCQAHGRLFRCVSVIPGRVSALDRRGSVVAWFER